MIRKILFWILFYCMLLPILQSYSQVTKKDGIFYRNYKSAASNLISGQSKMTGVFNYISAKTNKDSITIIKPDFIVNEPGGYHSVEKGDVSAAIDGNGNSACVWVDFRNGQQDIYAQFFNSNGEKIDSNLLVNERTIAGNEAPFIAADKNGGFIVVWIQYYNGVMAQRFSSDGQKIGGSYIVSAVLDYNLSEASAAINDDGSFMITWSYGEYTSSGQNNYFYFYHIFAKLFDSLGNPISSEIPINYTNMVMSSYDPGKRITIDSLGNYFIVWNASVDSNSNIYCQKMNRNGEKIGGNILISNSSENANNIFPKIVSTEDGHCLVVWDIDSGINARVINPDNSLTSILKISLPENTYNQFGISSDKGGKFLISYFNSSGSYFQYISKSCKLSGVNVKVNYNTKISGNIFPEVITDYYNNQFHVFPLLIENHDYNIYSQIFENNLIPVGPFTKVNDDSLGAWQTNPFVRFNNNGGAIVLWNDDRNRRNDLYAQVYDIDFNPVGGNVMINNNTESDITVSVKDVKCQSDGSFIILFDASHSNTGGGGLYLQKININGEKTGLNIHVSDIYSFNNQFKVLLSINSADEILACCYNNGGAFLRRFSKALSPLNNENYFMQYLEGTAFNSISISIDREFNVFVTWQILNNNNSRYEGDLKGRFFNKDGVSTSAEFVIDEGLSYIYDLNVINDSLNYAVIYTDQNGTHLDRKYNLDKEYKFTNKLPGNGYINGANLIRFSNRKLFLTYSASDGIYALQVNDNIRDTTLYQLNMDGYFAGNSGTFSTDLHNGELFLAYETTLNIKNGTDILGKVWDFGKVSFDEEKFDTPISDDILKPNFPNPFNSMTKIKYEILSYHKVKLVIYDILGREVKVLVDEDQGQGKYEVEFNASNLSSGIYFCRLEAFKTSVRKMILLK